jgi:replicative DNA helicase
MRARKLSERFVSSRTQTYGDAVSAFLDDYHRRAEAGATSAGVKTGFKDLDDLIGGLCDGEFVVIAADTGQGKSALALNLALNVARDTQKHVFFVSLEMLGREIGGRGLCLDAGVNMAAFRSMSLSPAEWDKVNHTSGIVHDTPLLINDEVRLTLPRLRAEALVLKQRHDIALVVVDYLQLLALMVKRGAGNDMGDPEAIAETSRELKLLAMELERPVIALSQFNRAASRRVEQDAEAQYTVADLKGSSAIGQDANTVLLMRANKEERLAEIAVAKHRSSRTGVVKLRFIPELTKFESLPRENDPRELPPGNDDIPPAEYLD